MLIACFTYFSYFWRAEKYQGIASQQGPWEMQPCHVPVPSPGYKQPEWDPSPVLGPSGVMGAAGTVGAWVPMAQHHDSSFSSPISLP